MTTATTAGREVTYLEAISQALDEEMARDERVFLMGEDIGPYGGAFRITEGVQQKYGEWRGLADPPVPVAGGGGRLRGAHVWAAVSVRQTLRSAICSSPHARTPESA